jgi:hypothetical protein
MTTIPTVTNADNIPGFPGVSFGLSIEGFPVARVRDWQPDAWEAIFARVLAPGQSHVKDRRTFETEHANDWVVISALRSYHRTSMTEVIATRGGKRDPRLEERRFLVPAAEYEVGRFGFVIDETQHATYNGPSTFLTSSGRGTT